MSDVIALIRAGAFFLPASDEDLARLEQVTGKRNMLESEYDDMLLQIAKAGLWLETHEYLPPAVPDGSRVVEIRHANEDWWFVAHRSTRHAGFQLSEFRGLQAVGHTDWDDLNDAVRSACGVRARGQTPVGTTKFRVTSTR